ncbi:MAG: hypothetical protein RLY14_2704 [Planctomycetota bacterium]|jgi:hypothetical protein
MVYEKVMVYDLEDALKWSAAYLCFRGEVGDPNFVSTPSE